MKIIRRDKEQKSEESKIESGDNDGYDVLDQDVGGGAESEKNMFKLDDDEMIEIGHDIDNVDHQTEDALQKHQNSVILKVDKEKIELEKDSFSLPALTPPPENEEVANEKEEIDDDFGEFQTPNDEEPDIEEQKEE